MSEAKKNEAMSPEKLDLESMNIVNEQKAKLKDLFPEIVTEGGKIDFDRLRMSLGDAVDVGKERYGLNWAGKSDCFRTIQRQSSGALVPLREESLKFDETKNVLIEGDNLEVLKLLQKSYLGKIKMIYIDPPYNTGNDFIYPDDFSESLETYLKYSGQVDSEGRKYSSNSETDGRFHSKWLSMMYPRLFLARNLLRDDGLIFISINDAEQDNLKKIAHDIFGEEHFIGMITWKARVKPVNIGEAKYRPQKETEYVLVYEKANTEGKFLPLLSGGVREYPHTFEGRKYRLATILKSNRGANFRPTMVFEFKGYAPPEGQRWQASEDVIGHLDATGCLEFKDGTPFRRYFEDEEGAEHDPFYCFLDGEWTGTSEQGKTELNNLVGNTHGFDTVKPTRLIKTLIASCTRPDSGDIILDFFGGSGTTAEAVMMQNKEDNGNRRWVLVQLPEPTENPQCATIAKLCQTRIRKVIERENSQEDDRQATIFAKPTYIRDLGMRVFALKKSAFKIWEPVTEEKESFTHQLALHQFNVDPSRMGDDLLIELLLKSGFQLDSEIRALVLADKTVYSIHEGALLVCLERRLSKDVIREMASIKPIRIVCLDAGFMGDDQLKVNAVETFKAKGITFKTV